MVHSSENVQKINFFGSYDFTFNCFIIFSNSWISLPFEEKTLLPIGEGSDWMFDNISGAGGKSLIKWQCSNIFLHKLKLHIFQDHLKKHCSPMEKGRVEFSKTFLELGGNSEQNGNVQIFFYLNYSNCARQFHYGAKPASKWVSQPIAKLYRLISQPKNWL